jgi:hypothetical protein
VTAKTRGCVGKNTPKRGVSGTPKAVRGLVGMMRALARGGRGGKKACFRGWVGTHGRARAVKSANVRNLVMGIFFFEGSFFCPQSWPVMWRLVGGTGVGPPDAALNSYAPRSQPEPEGRVTELTLLL